MQKYMFLNHFRAGRNFYGATTHYFSNYAYMKEWSRQNIADEDSKSSSIYLHDCVMATMNNRKDSEKVDQDYYWDFQNPNLSKLLTSSLEVL